MSEDAPSEPDPRFSLANERTLLAWVRTSVALLAAAVAVVKLVPGDEYSWLRRVIGVALAVLGLIVAGSAWQRYRAVQTAMQQGRPLPRSTTLPLLALGLAAVAALVVLLVAV